MRHQAADWISPVNAARTALSRSESIEATPILSTASHLANRGSPARRRARRLLPPYQGGSGFKNDIEVRLGTQTLKLEEQGPRPQTRAV